VRPETFDDSIEEEKFDTLQESPLDIVSNSNTLFPIQEEPLEKDFDTQDLIEEEDKVDLSIMESIGNSNDNAESSKVSSSSNYEKSDHDKSTQESESSVSDSLELVEKKDIPLLNKYEESLHNIHPYLRKISNFLSLFGLFTLINTILIIIGDLESSVDGLLVYTYISTILPLLFKPISHFLLSKIRKSYIAKVGLSFWDIDLQDPFYDFSFSLILILLVYSIIIIINEKIYLGFNIIGFKAYIIYCFSAIYYSFRGIRLKQEKD